MRLERLKLENYRNYERLDLVFDGLLHLFVGRNAQGKTNLLEAIHVLALARSHRTHADEDLVRWGSETAAVAGIVERAKGELQLELAVSRAGKKAKANGLERRKLSEYVGSLNVVLFAPEDLNLVKGAPGVRRRFLDMELGQAFPVYLRELSQYQRLLRQRNRLLRQYAGRPVPSGLLDVFSEQLAAVGVKVMLKRQGFIKKLSRWASDIHERMTDGAERLDVRYLPSLELDAEGDEDAAFRRFMVKLSQMREEELRRCVTLVGPHRDDLAFSVNGVDVQAFGSQGQQRTVALSLKLAEIELIAEETGEYPILLLDDVLSELDRFRRSRLIEAFRGRIQTFVTATSLEGLDFRSTAGATLYCVEAGRVRPAAEGEI